MLGSDARGRGGFGVWHCSTAWSVSACARCASPGPAGTVPCSSAGCGAAVMPRHCGTAEPMPAACLTPLLPASAEQARGSGVSGCPALLNPPKLQRKLGEVFFFLEKRRLCSALPRARGSSGAEQRILVLQGQPHALKYRAAAETWRCG